MAKKEVLLPAATNDHVPLKIPHGPYLPLELDKNEQRLSDALGSAAIELSDLNIQSLWQYELQHQASRAMYRESGVTTKETAVQIVLLRRRIDSARDEIGDWLEYPELTTYLAERAEKLTDGQAKA